MEIPLGLTFEGQGKETKRWANVKYPLIIYYRCEYLPLTSISLLVVCKMFVMYEQSLWPMLPKVSCSSVVSDHSSKQKVLSCLLDEELQFFCKFSTCFIDMNDLKCQVYYILYYWNSLFWIGQLKRNQHLILIHIREGYCSKFANKKSI